MEAECQVIFVATNANVTEWHRRIWGRLWRMRRQIKRWLRKLFGPGRRKKSVYPGALLALVEGTASDSSVIEDVEALESLCQVRCEITYIKPGGLSGSKMDFTRFDPLYPRTPLIFKHICPWMLLELRRERNEGGGGIRYWHDLPVCGLQHTRLTLCLILSLLRHYPLFSPIRVVPPFYGSSHIALLSPFTFQLP